MVMIPVGNRTSHCFRLWCFAETYIRMVITAVVIYRAQEVLSVGQLRFIAILFFIWSFRPIYLNFKELFRTWRDVRRDVNAEESKQ